MTFQHTDTQQLATIAVPAGTWLRTEQVAEILRKSPMQVTRWARKGRIHAVQPGGKHGQWLICPCAVQPLVEPIPYLPTTAAAEAS